jgi:putative membrane protein
MPWERLHPLSPVVRGARSGVPVVLLLAVTAPTRHNGSSGDLVFDLAIVALVVVSSTIHWLVTRWAFDGATLRIETGLVRRDSRQLPVARIQAVDVAQPFLARLFGLAELKIRLAGASRESRLAYLAEPRALQLRAALLAAHHGMDPATPEPAEQPVAIVPAGRLIASVLLSGLATVTLAVIVVMAVLAEVSLKTAAVVAGAGLIYFIALALSLWRRFNGQYGFTVALSADGIRVRRGLLGTVAETIPIRRVQAVRQIEPLVWRLFGWCRLEVDLAGMPGREQGGGSRRVTKTLLPVGPRVQVEFLRSSVVGTLEGATTRPPRRAWFKAPLSYHFLAAGHDDAVAVAVTGRLRKVTSWVPLEKAQSVRRVQGPLQRALGLASVHIDVAGKRIGAQLLERGADDSDRLVEDLAALTRVARQQTAPDPVPRTFPETASRESVATGHQMAPPGWFADPSGWHRGRFWNGVSWTAHVEDDGVPGYDPP